MKIKFLYWIPLVLLLFGSCKKFLDINTDPNNPTNVEPSKLLPTIERNLGDALAIGGGNNGGLSTLLAVYMHQMTTREEADQYGATGNEFFIGTSWPKLYSSALPSSTTSEAGVLQNIEDIIKKQTEAGNLRYVGIVKILKAYTYSQIVDVYGDVPFSEANKLSENILYPKFDDDATIYPALFTILDEGITALKDNSASNILTPGDDDVIYGGDTDKWIKAAKTIKLKLYLQVSKKQDVSAAVGALITEGDLISATDESFLIPYGPIGSTDDRNPGFADYYATQRSNHFSPWFYEILKGRNPRILNGNPDPRLPYYVYNQLSATQNTREDTRTEYRDGPFVSIYFGSVGPDRDRNFQNSISVFGIYPVGGRYDDGGAQQASAASGTGAAPYRLITYADRLYIESELMKEGVIAGDAKAKLQQAITESFNQVDYVVSTFVKPSQTVPPLMGKPEVATYISNVMSEYDANPGKQLEIIMTQKWISSFGSHVDQYTDYRRTGFPTIFDPNNSTMAPGGEVQPPVNGDPIRNPQPKVKVQANRAFPFSLPWYSLELETNPNAPSQKNPSEYKVFWMQ
jgi:hypothetical protein